MWLQHSVDHATSVFASPARFRCRVSTFLALLQQLPAHVFGPTKIFLLGQC